MDNSVRRRWWRWSHLTRNPLVRRWDRIESVGFVAAVLLAGLATHVAIAAGMAVYASGITIGAPTGARSPAAAVLVADVPAPGSAGYGIHLGGVTKAKVQWRRADGATVYTTVWAPKGAAAGTQVAVWHRSDGSVANTRVVSEGASSRAIGATLGVWVVLVGGTTVSYRLTRRLLDRARYARWEWDWLRVEADWSRS